MRRALSRAVLGAMVIGAPSALQAQTSDTTVPSLIEFDFSPSVIDVTNGPRDIAVTVRIGDDLSGIPCSLYDLLSVTVRGATAFGPSRCAFLESNSVHAIGVDHSTFTDNSSGVTVAANSGAWIRDSTFDGGDLGVTADQSDALTIEAVTAQHNQIGVLVRGNASAVVSGSMLSENEYGLLVETQGAVTTAGLANTIQQNSAQDVQCASRGILEVDVPQQSTTATTNVSPDCLVFGSIF